MNTTYSIVEESPIKLLSSSFSAVFSFAHTYLYYNVIWRVLLASRSASEVLQCATVLMVKLAMGFKCTVHIPEVEFAPLA